VSDSAQTKLSVCLVGCGEMGRLHAASIAAHPMLDQFIVCDSLMDAARSLAGEFGAKVMSVNEALACSDCDAIIIASLARIHLDHTARLTDKFSGIDSNICTWFRFIAPVCTTISCARAVSRSNSRQRLPTSPPSTG